LFCERHNTFFQFIPVFQLNTDNFLPICLKLETLTQLVPCPKARSLIN
jgi:hypothetical protein